MIQQLGVWVSLESGGGGPSGIFEINPNDGTVVSYLNVGPAFALGFNPKSGKLFFSDQNGVIKEVAPDGSGQATVFDPGVGFIFGMAFTPTGDLALVNFPGDPTQLLLYDSSDDADDVFTTAIPIAIDIKPNTDPNTIILTSKGTNSVAILTTADINANTADPTTVLFADALPIRRKMVDVDRDGDIDMLLSFNIQELNLVINSTEATLTGTMDDEMGAIPIKGTDWVSIVTKGKK